MKTFRADLHIHTVLSPCGSLEMSPESVMLHAKARGIDILGITDHNSTRNCKVYQRIGQKHGIQVLTGVEVNTREEIHALAFFESESELNTFQEYLDEHLPFVANNTDIFGYQVVIDDDEGIVDQIDALLINALDVSIDEVSEYVKQLNGIFIPAHINRQVSSVISQLGFVPPNLQYDALGISRHITKENFLKKNAYLNDKTFIQNSDAHFVEDIGRVYTLFHMTDSSFEEIRKALHNIDGRHCEIL
ncbi:MAG: PHP domain-containing protein [Bacteroidales bacterium]|nr:PHP domain-containing protein [Bacteroidales bacterium]